jgi:hypothetical protein
MENLKNQKTEWNYKDTIQIALWIIALLFTIGEFYKLNYCHSDKYEYICQ